MGEDKSVAQQVAAPALKPQAIRSKLASTPKNGPKHKVFVKDKNGNDIAVGDPAVTRSLIALMDVHAVTGGAACHWGGPAAFAEIISAIHGILFATTGREWYDAYNFVNDAGHAENGIYALRANYGFDNMTFDSLKGFRSIQSKLTGHGESHLNPEGVLLSNGPLSSAIPQAQGLALADHFAKRDRVTICTASDGASMEGEAKEAYAAIPGLAAKGLMNPFVLVISDNDTKLSGRISKDSFSMQPSFRAMDHLGWKVVRVRAGHDIQTVYSALEKAVDLAKADPKKPVFVWVKTIKGYGIKATEKNAAGGHGFPLANGEKIIDWIQEITHNNPPADILAWAQALRKDWETKQEAAKAKPAVAPSPTAVKKDKIQGGLSTGAIDAVKEGYPVFSISSDVEGSTGMSGFQKSLPDRFIEVGIAEANMISVGAGFSKAGFIPIVDTFGQFGVTKGNLPITMAALSQAPVIAVFSHVGLQDAADGASHQATTYFAALGSIPHTQIIACSCADEARSYIYQAIKHIAQAREQGKDGESVIFFVGRENYPIYWVEGAKYEWGKAQVIQDGSDVTLIAAGPLLGRTIEAGKQLATLGIKAAVINSPFINHPDIATIRPIVEKTKGRVITIEDHQIIGGLGSRIVHELSISGLPVKAKTLGINGEFGQSAYMAEDLYKLHGLTKEKLVEAAQSLVKV